MKQEIATLWTAALLSGEYEQTTAVLRRDTIIDGGNEEIPKYTSSFCCLGVLCELAHKAGVEGLIRAEPRFDGFCPDVAYSDRMPPSGSNTLPDVVLEWAGMRTAYGALNHLGGNAALTQLNDNGRTFTEIADIIKANVDGL